LGPGLGDIVTSTDDAQGVQAGDDIAGTAQWISEERAIDMAEDDDERSRWIRRVIRQA
jgi:hypothetical protein